MRSVCNFFSSSISLPAVALGVVQHGSGREFINPSTSVLQGRYIKASECFSSVGEWFEDVLSQSGVVEQIEATQLQPVIQKKFMLAICTHASNRNMLSQNVLKSEGTSVGG
jgi:hypothetical protein